MTRQEWELMDIGVQRLASCSLTLPLAQGSTPKGGGGRNASGLPAPFFVSVSGACPGRGCACVQAYDPRTVYVSWVFANVRHVCVKRASFVPKIAEAWRNHGAAAAKRCGG